MGLETDFDIICNTLVGTSINTPVIVTDQVGLSRSTQSTWVACLFKEFQINASFEGLVETVPGVNLDLLKMDKYKMDPAKDPLFRGEFPVVLALLEKLKGGKEAKNECDKVIDKNGTPKTGGNGIKQLRENIAESKLSYEIMDDAAQAFLKVKIMDNIHNDRRAESCFDPARWQDCHPRQPAEAPQDLRCLHGGALRSEGTDRLWQGRPAVGA